MTKCSYCDRQWKEINECCAYCGAPNQRAKKDYYYPFFYDGYIIYEIRRYDIDCFEFHFYKGVTYMGKINVTWKFIDNHSPTEDTFPLVMDAFYNKVEIL